MRRVDRICRESAVACFEAIRPLYENPLRFIVEIKTIKHVENVIECEFTTVSWLFAWFIEKKNALYYSGADMVGSYSGMKIKRPLSRFAYEMIKHHLKNVVDRNYNKVERLG